MTGPASEKIAGLAAMRYFQTVRWRTVHIVLPNRPALCGVVFPVPTGRWLSETELDKEGLWGRMCCTCLRSFDRLAALKEAPREPES